MSPDLVHFFLLIITRHTVPVDVGYENINEDDDSQYKDRHQKRCVKQLKEGGV